MGIGTEEFELVLVCQELLDGIFELPETVDDSVLGGSVVDG